MRLGLEDDTHLVCSLQRVITTLLNQHTRAVTTCSHHHHLGFVALIVIESLNGTSIDADNHLARVRMPVDSRLRSGQQHVQHPLPILILAVTQIIVHTQPRRLRSQLRHRVSNHNRNPQTGMKQLLINLKSLIKRGLVRIFPRISTLSTAFKCAIALAIVFTLLCSCGSTRHVTQLVRDIQRDTIFLSNTQYDSIYIYKDRMQDRSKDTVYLKDVSIEYRYKLLRDTVYKVQHDSIPYEVTVVQTKEITRPLTLFDKLCRSSFFLMLGALLFYLISFIRKLKLI